MQHIETLKFRFPCLQMQVFNERLFSLWHRCRFADSFFPKRKWLNGKKFFLDFYYFCIDTTTRGLSTVLTGKTTNNHILPF